MLHKGPLLIFSILLPLFCHAQKVKLLQATSTGWSGGIAGRYGTGYNFIVQFSHCGKQEPEPDTLWIGNKYIPLVTKPASGQSYNLIKTAERKKVTFQVWGGTSWEDEEKPILHYPNSPEQKKINKPFPPIRYEGVALLSYKYNGKQRYFVIDKIMTFGTPVNYP